MSSRILTSAEILAVGAILKDKEAISLLKEIKENVITEEDTKGKRKTNDINNFVGFASGDDVLGDDPDSIEYKQKKSKIDSLVSSGLVQDGFHIPLERKNEKKFGDQKIAATDEKIYKYQLTNEGYEILNLTEEKSNAKGVQETSKKLWNPPTKNDDNSSDKSKEVAEFKKEQSKELGLETKEKA